MSIDDLSKVAGVLGFFISLATFALTRWERRVVLDFGLDPGSSSSFGDEGEEPMSTVNLTVTNLSARPALLDMRSLDIHSNGNAMNVWREDCWGKEKREVLLKPNESQTIGIPQATFDRELKIKPPEKYDEKSFNLEYPLVVRLKASNGRSYVSKKLRYWEATGEFRRVA
jgi:hypothetical protein